MVKLLLYMVKGACALALGNAIAQNVIPCAKILKVKKQLKLLVVFKIIWENQSSI